MASTLVDLQIHIQCICKNQQQDLSIRIVLLDIYDSLGLSSKWVYESYYKLLDTSYFLFCLVFPLLKITGHGNLLLGINCTKRC